MRLIDADELIKNLQEMADLEWNQQVGSSKGIEDAIDVIENFPTVEDRPTGKWESPFPVGDITYHKCSNCHISTQLILITNYCPNCGARMEESDDE